MHGYNTQISAESVFQLIVGQQVTQAANDKQQLAPLVEKIKEQSGQKPQEVVADSGYCSEENLKYLNKRKIEGFVATGKQKHNERREPCKPGPLAKGASRVQQMERKLATQAGAAVYATRKFIVEPVFGQIKQAARIPTVSLTRTGESTRGVGTDLHDSQHSEVSQDHLQWIAQELSGAGREAVPEQKLFTGPARTLIRFLLTTRIKSAQPEAIKS